MMALWEPRTYKVHASTGVGQWSYFRADRLANVWFEVES